MKAAHVAEYGGSDVIEIVDVEKPALGDNHLLVEVRAASINPFDAKLRQGLFKDGIPMQFPYIPGADYAGFVREVGKGVEGYAAGDEVYGHAIILQGSSGAFAEYTAANVANTAKKPTSIDFIAASSLPLVGSSAVQALEEHMQLKRNQKILIHGGAGGIGSVAIQIAKHIGAYVATTVSADDKEFVRSLGADKIVDYKSEKFENEVKDFDAVYDTVGGAVMEKSFDILRRGGVLVSMVGEPSQEKATTLGVTAIAQQTKTNTEHLKRVAELVEQGAITPHVDTVFPFERIREAFDRLETGSPRGKVVLKIA
jgi:alcohol dehydrogenase